MNRLAPIALAALLVSPLIRADDSTADLQKFDGTWTMINLEESGKAASREQMQAMSVVFDDGKYEVKEGGMIVESGSLKIDATKSPKTVDFKIEKGEGAGKTQVGVYQFDRDTLKLCVALPPGATTRPKTLATKPDSQTLLMVMKKKSS